MSWVQTEQFACLCVQILIFCVQMVKCSKVTAHPVHHWEKRWQHATSLQCLLQCSHLSQPACTHKCPSCNKGESFEKVETNSKANSQLNQVGSVLVPFLLHTMEQVFVFVLWLTESKAFIKGKTDGLCCRRFNIKMKQFRFQSENGTEHC